MNNREFFQIFFNHLNRKNDEVMRIVALGTNLEKWFQGEMALAFSDSKAGYNLNDNYKILSSEFYNNESDELSQEDWDRIIGERGIISLEGNIYKSVKTERRKSSGVRKVDFLLENQKEIIFSELKIIWLSSLSEDPYGYLEKKKVLEDAWRLRTNLYKQSNKNKTLRLFITLICIDDYNFNNPNEIKQNIIESLNQYFEEDIFNNLENRIIIKKIEYQLHGSNSISLGPYDNISCDGYLILINIPSW